MNLPEKLFVLLNEIEKSKPKSFSGIGLIVYNNLNNLPISPLKKSNDAISLPIIKYDYIKAFLTNTSVSDNEFHDGFHFLNSKFELTHICQYIAPPIINIEIKTEFGSRYRTAIYASSVNGIIACGVLSLNYPPTVFVKGQISSLT